MVPSVSPHLIKYDATFAAFVAGFLTDFLTDALATGFLALTYVVFCLSTALIAVFLALAVLLAAVMSFL